MLARVAVLLYFLLSILFGARLTIAHFALPMDFGSFIASGELALAGENPYDPDHELVFNVPIFELNLVIASPNLNPPISIMPFEWIASAGLDPNAAAGAWKIISFLMYLALVYHLIRLYPHNATPFTVLWAVSLAGFWQTVQVGQIYVPLVFMAAVAWRNLETKNQIMAGLFIGLLISIKPQFVLWAIFLLLIDQKTVFFTSLVVSILISIIPGLAHGGAIYMQWVDAIRQYNGILLPGNMSLQSLFTHTGLERMVLWADLALLGCILLHIKTRKTDALQTSLLALLAIVLIPPYSWSGYSLFLLPFFFSEKKWSWRMTISAGLLCFPFAFVLEYFTRSTLHYIVFGWIYGWAMVLLLWDGIAKWKPDVMQPAQGKAGDGHDLVRPGMPEMP